MSEWIRSLAGGCFGFTLFMLVVMIVLGLLFIGLLMIFIPGFAEVMLSRD